MSTLVTQSPAAASLRTTFFSGLGAMALAALVLAPWTAPCGAANEAGAQTMKVRVVDVTAMFTEEGFDAYSTLGGVAAEVPLDNPAHIFRFLPSDRTDIDTDRHTFFLEDPGHAPSRRGCGSPNALMITPPDNVDADVLVYRIVGDLMIDNDHALSMQLFSRPGQAVVFDVEGDVIFGDNFIVADRDADVTFRARPDINGHGGNIVLDDAFYGTLRLVEAHLDGDRLITGRVNPAGVVIRGTVTERVVDRM